jgi:hydroxymethylpyrimidine pyrophosphatase-like HAD family hydrolase
LLPIEGINIVSACDYNIEITPADAGKGNALSALAKRLGVHISETIAVGDSENDIQMLTVAGLGLAMDNAVEKAKHIADEIICNNNENVADFIAKKYF